MKCFGIWRYGGMLATLNDVEKRGLPLITFQASYSNWSKSDPYALFLNTNHWSGLYRLSLSASVRYLVPVNNVSIVGIEVAIIR